MAVIGERTRDSVPMPAMPSYAKGGVVTKTGPAFLHKGEKVSPLAKSLTGLKRKGKLRGKKGKGGKGYNPPAPDNFLSGRTALGLTAVSNRKG